MLSHDNLVWDSNKVRDVLGADRPEIIGHEGRVVSYLPLSHIAGLVFDVLQHLSNVSQLYFARPDALQGTLVETLQWARPTVFLAVPRVWEKFEERMKELAASKPGFVQSISTWAKGYGTANTMAKMNKQSPPFMYGFANWLLLKRIRQNLGLDACKVFYFGAAPLK